MVNFNQADLVARIQLSMIKYNELISLYIDYLRYGKNVSQIEQKLIILSAFIELLTSYNISLCSEANWNCLTEKEVQGLSDSITDLTGICFQPPGYNYTNSSLYQGIGSMQIGCNFIVS